MIKLETKKTTHWVMTSIKNGDKITFTSTNKERALSAFQKEIKRAFKNIDNPAIYGNSQQIDRFRVIIGNEENNKETQEITLANDNLAFTTTDAYHINRFIYNLKNS